MSMSALSIPDLQRLLTRNLPAVDHRGEVVEEIGDNVIRMRLPVEDAYLSHQLPGASGLLSGPMTMGFADTALYACVHAFYGADVLAMIVNFNVSFLRAAGGGDLIAVARLVKQGKTLAFVEAQLFSGASAQPCVQVVATYAIRPVTRPDGVGA
jgi:uncharacterized protein (TIGR00369 family)